MNNILNKIKGKKGLTKKEYQKLISFLEKDNEIKEIIEINQKSKYYFIYIKDKKTFNNAFEEIVRVEKDLKNKDFTGRMVEALKGNSHKSKCSKNILMIKQKDEDDGRFVLLPNDKSSPKKENVLIIENMETFIDNDFINKLKIMKNKNIEIIWGAGNYITSKDFREYLKKYKTVYALFDWDYEGLSFYFNLKRNQINVKWYVEDFFFELDKYKKIKLDIYENKQLKKEELSKFLTLKEDEETKRTVNYIIKNKIKVEQEIFQTILKERGLNND